MIILLHSYIKISRIHLFILQLFSGGICATFINNIIRHIIGRIDIKQGLANNFSKEYYGFVPFSHFSSLPSGHSTLIAVIATSIILFYPRQKILAVSLYLVVVSSLILTNSHYLTDCLVGLVLGSLVSIIVFKYGILHD
ncbi:MAG: phosphatase PAP2 family protein [Legionellales bacterium]|nr:phosphatase PAP2 family protein [Legionellales bacterium]